MTIRRLEGGTEFVGGPVLYLYVLGAINQYWTGGRPYGNRLKPRSTSGERGPSKTIVTDRIALHRKATSVGRIETYVSIWHIHAI